MTDRPDESATADGFGKLFQLLQVEGLARVHTVDVPGRSASSFADCVLHR